MAIAAESSAFRSLLRFNLKTMLAVMAIVAILLVPVQWFGALYLVSVASSAVLVSACCFAYFCRSRGRTLGYAFMGLIVAFPFGMLVVLGHAFLNLLLCAALIAFRAGPKAFLYAVVGLPIILYGIVIWNGLIEVRALEVLRQKYPIESLLGRLAFAETSQVNAAAKSAPLQLTPTVAAHLDEIEERQSHYHFRSRPGALRQLHENTRMQFAFAAGFGPARMPMLLSPRLVEFQARERLALPVSVDITAKQPSASELYPVHRGALLDFTDFERMGYVRSREEVAGFESHAISALSDPREGSGNAKSMWQVTRLELVSLLRDRTPRVYVAASLPSMDQLAGTPHRQLNDFEAKALPQLDSAGDVVIEQTSERIQMLGAVRATSDCLQCHEGQRGQLLGAFSYEIAPIANTARAAK